MPWTDPARRRYARAETRYATDLTDAEFALIAPHLPAPNRLGRPRTVDLREVLNAILHLLRTIGSGAADPVGSPAEGASGQEHGVRPLPALWGGRHLAGAPCRAGRDGARAGRQGGLPQRRRLDSRSAKATEAGGPRGYDAGKRINGRKRHILVDALGLLPVPVVHAANVQDRDGLALVCRRVRRRFPWPRLVLADGGYQGETAARAAAQERLRLRIVRRDPGVRGFAALPKRWLVERTFAWLGRNRRLAKDFEASVTSSATMINLASMQLLTRRLARA
jgi:putative transposase